MKYTNELQGQEQFYKDYLPRVDKSLTSEQVFSDNTDGVLFGNLLEFKLTVNDTNATLFQAIKYLSAMRVKGKSIPANIVLVSLNTDKVFIYQSKDYLEEIEKIYQLGASKENTGFKLKSTAIELDLSQEIDQEKLVKTLKSKNFTKINIDENCIVGWGQRFYKENPTARKADFIGDQSGKVNILGEIRKPNKLKDYIEPYKGEDNVKFRYLMDKLNDDLQKKNLGAFYTPELYAEKSLELVRKAIDRVPAGNDYVIIDRCAGTGNLEQYLTDEELSHVIVSTLEYYEYKVLMEILGDKVRHVIPPPEKEDTFNMGLVRGADALSKEYVENPLIKQYVDNPNCTIILFENPPYAETTSIEHQKKKQGAKSSEWKKSYVVQEMKKDTQIKGTASNDLGNAFIWSAFQYYLRQPTDSYIVYSPVKYWKAQHIINKQFIDGFAFNRRHFHTTIDACIMVALWGNSDCEKDYFEVKAFDIDVKKGIMAADGILPIRRIYTTYSNHFFDKRKFEDDEVDGIYISLDGSEREPPKQPRITPLFNENIIGYMAVYSSGFDNPDLHASLLIAGRYDGNGFFLRSDNFLEKLPMFAASRYITYNRKWTERARVMKSADGADSYTKDLKDGKLSSYLLKVLLFTTLEMQNHLRSFTGSDGRMYRNQLCLDNTNRETLATLALKKLKLNATEKELLEVWKTILNEAKKTKNYQNTINYGVYQISTELNTFQKDQITDKNIYDYPLLNGSLKTLKELVKRYYNNEIVPKLFEYEFLK